MPERLSINSEMFATMREQFDDILNSLIEQMEVIDDAEITVKLKLSKVLAEDREKILASWDVVRTIKAKKFKVGGLVTDDYFLDKDEDGNLIIRGSDQISFFD